MLDLKIFPNTVTALVSGSSSQPYKIKVSIKSLDPKIEKRLMEKSRASLDSMQALLSGEFPADLKEEFFKQGTGLFPTPKEIELDCSCPDWAEMCKHVAAALYGTAVRLDEKPELFFTLRGMQINDFVGKMVRQESAKMLKKANVKSERVLSSEDADVSELFGIAMDGGTYKIDIPKPGTIKTKKPPAQKKIVTKKSGKIGVAKKKKAR